MPDLKSPELTWKNDRTPIATAFDDVYFSADDGIAESLYVFVNGCGLPDAFEGRDHFTVAETGFGTGLNFLLTYQAWKASQASCQLHYISVEAYPLSKEQLNQSHDCFEGLGDYAKALQDVYPDIHEGFHHLILEDGKVKLILLFGFAADMFKELNASVDAWYLDGFAPAKNPEMWNDDVFEQMGRLSNKGCIVSTFTAAGFVKRGLQAVGFEMRKRKGFGFKRESLIGEYIEDQKKLGLPWFQRSIHSNTAKKIAIIGAGIGGLVTAFRLQQDGHDVCVFERNPEVGMEASGNKLGLIQPRLTKNGGFNVDAYLHALRFYDLFPHDVWVGERGIYQIAKTRDEEKSYKDLFEQGVLPADHMSFLTAEEISKRIYKQVDFGGLFLKQAVTVCPEKLCRNLSEGLNVKTGVQINAAQLKSSKIFLKQKDNTIYECDALINCAAGLYDTIHPDLPLDLRGRRGQIDYVQTTDVSENKHPISHDGYLIPDTELGAYVVGASFDRWTDFHDDTYKEISAESTAHNLDVFQKNHPAQDVKITGSRASIRAMTKDHLPIVGPVFDPKVYREKYKNICHGEKARDFESAEYLQGQYVLTGLGARGIQTAPLLADILSCYINNTPCPTRNDVRESLHPARFLIRDLKKARP